MSTHEIRRAQVVVEEREQLRWTVEDVARCFHVPLHMINRRTHTMTIYHPLIGKTITGFDLTNDRKAMRFVMADGEPVVALCDAECCSETWVEHVSLPARGFPAVVLDAADIEMPNLGEMPDRDVVKYYGFKVVTDKGEMVVDYRNDSNGYYGGNLSWPGQSHYGGVYRQNVPILEWRSVTQDE